MIKIKTSLKIVKDVDTSVTDEYLGYSSSKKPKIFTSNKVNTKRTGEKNGKIEQNVNEAFHDISENIIKKVSREIGKGVSV